MIKTINILTLIVCYAFKLLEFYIHASFKTLSKENTPIPLTSSRNIVFNGTILICLDFCVLL